MFVVYVRYLVCILLICYPLCLFFFFLNDAATPELYPLPPHDALPICGRQHPARRRVHVVARREPPRVRGGPRLHVQVEHGLEDRKSTRLNSSHANISYAVFCLKKKKNTKI